MKSDENQMNQGLFRISVSFITISQFDRVMAVEGLKPAQLKRMEL